MMNVKKSETDGVQMAGPGTGMVVVDENPLLRLCRIEVDGQGPADSDVVDEGRKRRQK